MNKKATNPSRFLTLLVLAGLGSSVVLVVWNCLLAAQLLEPRRPGPTHIAEQLTALAAEIEASASSRRSPVADLDAKRKQAADDASDLCRIRDEANPLFAQMAVLPGAGAVAEATEALDRGCAYRGQFGYPTDFASFRALRDALSARRAESLAAVEIAAARLRSSGSQTTDLRHHLSNVVFAILAGLACAVALTAALLSFYKPAESPSTRIDYVPSWPAASHGDRETILSQAQTFATELTIIGGYNQMLLAALPHDHPNRKDLEETSLAVARAEDTVQHMVMGMRPATALEVEGR